MSDPVDWREICDRNPLYQPIEEPELPAWWMRLWSALWPWLVVALYLYLANEMAKQLAQCEWPQW
jgi:hypothetical protein